MTRSTPGTPAAPRKGRAVDLKGAHRAVKRASSGVYIRWTAWRGQGAPVIGSYRGETERQALALEKADARGRAQAYVEAVKGAKAGATVADLLLEFEASADFKRLAASTQTQWGYALRYLRAGDVGRLPVKALAATQAHAKLVEWHEELAQERGARAADYQVQVLRRALAWACKRSRAPANPAEGIEGLWRADRSDLIWEPEHLAAMRAAAARLIAGAKQAATRAQLQAALDVLDIARLTGMRRDDLSAHSWDEVRQGEGAVVYTPRKAERRARSSGKAAMPVVVPILPELAEIYDRLRPDPAAAVQSPWVIRSSRGGRYTANALGTIVGDLARAAGVDRHLHDARGTFVTLMRSAGVSREEVADMVGWEVAQLKRIERRYLSASSFTEARIRRLSFRTVKGGAADE